MKHVQVRVEDELARQLDPVKDRLGLPTLQALGLYALQELVSPTRKKPPPALADLTPEQYQVVVDVAVLLRQWPQMEKVLRALLDAVLASRRQP